MVRATVDPWATPNLNAITFPAGILQPPMFDVDADDAVNYGGIGMVIGHEIVHLFDDQGPLFDSRGSMRDWWTPSDAAAFKQRTDRLVAQFNDYTVLDGLHINGQLTLGENTADVGGLLIAYEAFKRTPQGKSSEMKDGFTPDQRLFLAHAQNWRNLRRDNSLRLQVQADPHSPPHLRVNGPVSNVKGFSGLLERFATIQCAVRTSKRSLRDYSADLHLIRRELAYYSRNPALYTTRLRDYSGAARSFRP
jgi:putative endopeptidase